MCCLEGKPTTQGSWVLCVIWCHLCPSGVWLMLCCLLLHRTFFTISQPPTPSRAPRSQTLAFERQSEPCWARSQSCVGPHPLLHTLLLLLPVAAYGRPGCRLPLIGFLLQCRLHHIKHALNYFVLFL